ncbi:DUF4260 domain-containing protein [Pedobacter sp. L105]|uniref:DUF4260 domain-containing protein n=1 Tax=Pedobacter sp. L105 TaxID=1641871 RepID=UPI00131B5694|nr:DUF4260 domain-containing protein [Pedobacter sp. L105]
MKTIIKLEEAALTAISIYFLTKYSLGLPVWIWVLLFFSPDLSMLGYLAGNRIGAFTYNLVHHRAIALLIVAVGLLTAGNITIAIGILLFAHSSFDRMFGYGLKHDDDFKHTHLGWMGNEKLAIK